jgi:hypothetical protein
MNLSPKIAEKYECKKCNYICCKQSDYNKHILTLKHQKSQKLNNLEQNVAENRQYTCKHCSKSYNARNSLWYHEQKCFTKNELIESNNNNNNDVLVEYLLKENKEIKQMIIELAKKDSYNNCHNTTTTHTNSHNKAFNLNFFLNETCKEAMNIGEFVDSLKIQLSDLEKVGKAGYIEGISNIIVKNLKELDVTKRPVHCTDKKRETVYIKDEDKWEKDEDKSQMHKLIKKVVSKNVKMFPKFREAHPDCTTYHSKFSDQYNKIIYESMGGKGDDDFEKNEKIIKNVLKEVVVNKNI